MSRKTLMDRVFDVLSENNRRHGHIQGITEDFRREKSDLVERKESGPSLKKAAEESDKEIAHF